MLTIFSNRFTFLTLIIVSLCQVRCDNRKDCTLNNDYTVLNENGAEVSATILNTNSAQDDGYYNLNFAEGKFEINGNIKAWCVDLARRIRYTTYDVDVFNSMDESLFVTQYPDAVDKPQYIPAINWLINNCNSGTEITIQDCATNHTITDRQFQLAVWRLVDNATDPSDLPSQFYRNEDMKCVVDHLVEKAEIFKDYKVDCTASEELIGLIVLVDDEEDNIQNQVMIMEVLLSDTDLCINCDKDAPEDPELFGDPHFKTWAGEYYDFHGVCDLVLIKNPEFQNGMGMDIHVRTTRMRMWSYVSNAAIRIGEDIFEIVGGQVENKFWINGVPGENMEISTTDLQMTLASTISGFPIQFKQPTSNQREFVIDLGEHEKIIFKTWNSFISVQVKNAQHEDFQNSVGLMGSFPLGIKLARDSTSVIDELDTFGQEWQVLDSEQNLFHDIVGPQHPARCAIPAYSEMRRRLGESTVTTKQAQKACANVNKDVMDLCVFDVMATSDELIVGAY